MARKTDDSLQVYSLFVLVHAGKMGLSGELTKSAPKRLIGNENANSLIES